MSFIRRLVAVASAVALVTACGGTRPQTATISPVLECAVTPTSTFAPDSATIVLTSAIDPSRLTRPTTWGERFVFELTNDTSRVDCAGRPLGGIAYRIASGRPSTLLLEPLGRGPRLTVRTPSEADARDLIDGGVDLLVTESQALATYAGTRADVTSIPLPWDRTWVVLTAVSGGLGLDSSATGVRLGFARDVVRADARVAEGPYWWSDLAGCGAQTTAPETRAASAPGSSRIVYPRDEPIARAVAERLVALVGAGSVATGLAPNAFASSMAAGTELAYVLPLPRRSLDRCRAVGDLLAAAPWIGRLPSPQDAIAPLVDTRLRAVARRDRLALTFTSDSTITVTPERP